MERAHRQGRRRPNLQQQKSTVENHMRPHGGSSLQRIHLWPGKLVVESANIEQNEKMGITHGEKIISFQKQRKRNVVWVLHENGKTGKHHLGRNKDSHSPPEVIAESMWRTLGWVCARPTNAVMQTLQHISTWRSTCWWPPQKTYRIETHSGRLNRLGTRTGSRRGVTSRMGMSDYVMFALMNVKHSLVHTAKHWRTYQSSEGKKKTEELQTHSG